MKNLLSHFRRKPSESADAPVPPSEAPKAQAAPIEPVRMQTPVARTIKPAWHTPAAPFPQKQRATAQAERSATTEMITLRLGDFLDRIPPELLDAGTHDRLIPMPFDLAALSERIGRGDSTIRLTEVYRRMPDVFRTDAVIRQDRVIPFPWKRVLAMIQEAKAGAVDGGITRSGMEMLAQKFKARRLRQPSKAAPVPGPAGGAEARKPAGASGTADTSASAASDAPASPAEATASAGLSANITTTSSVALEVAQLTVERDAALARAAEFGAEYESMIGRTGELTAERDAALARAAELTAERDAAAARVAEIAAEREAAVARLSEPAAGREADVARIAELTAQRDEALSRAAKFSADSDAAVALAAEVTAERDAAKTQIAELASARESADARVAALAGERDAAVARCAELTAERDAAGGRVAAITGERDAAAARIAEIIAERDSAAAGKTKLVADSDAAVALATELTTERDAATARIAALTVERDEAVARSAAVTAERDSAAARVAELLKISEARPQAASESPVAADSGAAIEGYRNTIDALMRERDALRAEQQQIKARLGWRAFARSVAAGEKATPPATADEVLPDVYSALFPQRSWMPRAAGALLLGLLGIGVASQTNIGTTRPAGAETPAVPSSGPEADLAIPTLTPAAIPDGEFTLESAATGEAASAPSQEPLSGAAEFAGPSPAEANPIEWKPITSRRAR